VFNIGPFFFSPLAFLDLFSLAVEFKDQLSSFSRNLYQETQEVWARLGLPDAEVREKTQTLLSRLKV
jgi:hypothetical protein